MHGGEARQVVYAHKARDRPARYCATQGVDACRGETVHRAIAVSIDRLSRHDIITRLTQARLLPAVLHYGRSSRPVYAHKRGGPTGAASMRVFPLDDAAVDTHSTRARKSLASRVPGAQARELPASASADFMRTNSRLAGAAVRPAKGQRTETSLRRTALRRCRRADPTVKRPIRRISAPHLQHTAQTRPYLRHRVYAHKPIVRMANA